MINKNFLKKEKVITLMILAVTIIIMVIITGTLAANSYDSTQVSKLTRMENDIQVLSDRVAIYFVEHDELPVLTGSGNTFTKSQVAAVMNDISANDGETYYKIDLSLFDNVSLNYGEDYLSTFDDDADMYIINEESHVIYYVKGVTYKGTNYHTVGDDTAVNLNY